MYFLIGESFDLIVLMYIKFLWLIKMKWKKYLEIVRMEEWIVLFDFILINNDIWL